MTPFHYLNDSDFCRIEFHSACVDLFHPILVIELQLCNLDNDFLDALKIISGADFTTIVTIDHDAYLNNC